jgi:hypothetical protein
VRDILKWEGIVNDPIGALLAVGIYAYIVYEGDGSVANVTFDVLGASFLAGIIGAALGYGLTWVFPRGYVPEYLKAPILLICVILGFVVADLIMHETGLITVTIMGVVMANRHVYSSRALHRFKEDLSVLLISGVFILLSAQLDWATVQKLQIQFILFLLLLLFVVRPVTVLISLLLSSVPWRERLFIAWIAPRGIVAVAITGLFASRLINSGYADAEALVPLSFAVVIVTIFAHGFSAKWVAARLGIDEGKGEGILLVGANRWTIEFAVFLKSLDLPILVADTSRFALRRARQLSLDTYQGDILEEALDDKIDLGQFQHMIISTDNESYNQLLSSDLGPEFGYDQMTAMAVEKKSPGAKRGRVLLETETIYSELIDRANAGWMFSKTRLSDKFTYDDFKANLDEREEIVALLKSDNRLLPFSAQARPIIENGDAIISFIQPDSREELKAARKEQVEKDAAGKDAPDNRKNDGKKDGV